MGIKKGDTGQIFNQQFEEEEKLIDNEVVGMEEVSPELRARMRANIGDRIEEMKREKIYAHLSDDDLEALEYGKKVQQKLKEEVDNKEDTDRGETDREYDTVRAVSEEIMCGPKRASQKKVVGARSADRKQSRKKKPAKVLAGLVATLVLIIGMGTVSLGGPKSVIEIVKQIIGGREVVKINSGENIAKSDIELEEEAYQRITDEFMIKPVRISLRPEGMTFVDAEFDTLLQTVEITYTYGDEKLLYCIGAGYRQSSWSYNMEDKEIKKWTEEIANHAIELKKYKIPPDNRERYSASFELQGIEYFLVGNFKFEEFEYIIKNLHFPN